MPAVASTDTTGLERSAVLLASLGPELAARVLSQMEEKNVERLTREMTRLGSVRAEEQDQVLVEFVRRIRENATGAVGGIGYARRMLEEALGADRASKILDELNSEEPEQ